MQFDASAQEVDIPDPQGSRLAPTQSSHPEKKHQGPVAPGLCGELIQLVRGQIHVAPWGRFGSFTPRAGFDANSRSCTASSKMRASTEYAVCTTTAPRFAANCDTHAWTAAVSYTHLTLPTN